MDTNPAKYLLMQGLVEGFKLISAASRDCRHPSEIVHRACAMLNFTPIHA